MNAMEKTVLESKIIEALRTCYDPEIPADIYELGLIYGIDISDDGDVRIRMTLTTPNCPVAVSLPGEVEAKVNTIESVKKATVEVVWEPPWDPAKMSEAARLQLGLM
jgi:FeS assembly SUF system protein